MNFLKLIEERYPLAIGAILTGSYLSADYSISSSDIDIVVFDPSFSHITPQGLMSEGKRIDFTQVPVNNLDNLLRNDQFDQRGILLTMIAKGQIIKDNDDRLVEHIKTKVLRLFNHGIHDNLEKYKALSKGLQKIRKEFTKLLSPSLRFFLINEFFSIATEMELIKTSNWRMSGKHKGLFLMESVPHFIEELIILSKNAIINQNEDSFERIGLFADNYIEMSGNFAIANILEEKHIIIDFDYENLSIEDFILKILPAIRENSVLNSLYKCFSISNISMHRIFKNKISLQFSDNKSLNFRKEELLSQFKSTISKAVGPNYRYSLIPSYEANEDSPNNTFYEGLMEVTKEISIMNEQMILSQGSYDVNRQLMISTLIDSFLITYLNIEKEDCLKILYYLASRYIVNRHEQRQQTPETIASLKQKKFLHFNSHFQEYKTVMIQAAEKGCLIAQNIKLSEGKVYSSVVLKLKDALDNSRHNMQDLLKENSLTLDVIQSSLHETPPETVILFILTFQYTRPMLLLNSDQVTLGLTILASIKTQ